MKEKTCNSSKRSNTFTRFYVIKFPDEFKPTIMKRWYSLLALVGILVLSNCSQIEENNDPVLGLWSSPQVDENETQEVLSYEWIFNDAYLGRYNELKKGVIVRSNDFNWNVDNGTYTIAYPNFNKANDTAIVKTTATGESLVHVNGQILAVRD